MASGCSGMVRCEVISQGSACVTCAGLWAKTLQTRASVFEHNRDIAGVRFELSRPSDFRTQAQESGMLRPFLMLVSMSPAMRCILSVQLGWSIILERHFGDSHAEAWDIITRRSVGLRSRCKSTFARYNPLTAATGNWHTILEFVARAVFLPSYMSWEEEFHCEEIDSDTAAVECMAAKSSRLEAFEAELMEKMGKLQRSKMNRVQVCTVAQLVACDSMKKIVALQHSLGMDRQAICMYVVDFCFICLDSEYKQRCCEGDSSVPPEMEPEALAFEVATLVHGVTDDAAALFTDILADPQALNSSKWKGCMGCRMDVISSAVKLIGQQVGHRLGRTLAVFLQMMLQKERLKLSSISIDEFMRPAK